MTACAHCGQSAEENTMYCPTCGNKISRDAKEKETCLHHLRRNLRHERKCWSICGTVYWILFAIFTMMLLLSVIVAFMSESEELRELELVFPLCTIYSLIVALVNKSMAKRITLYLDTLDTDVSPAAERCRSAGPIVLGAFFNQLAMIFFIVNSAYVNSNRSLLEEIARDQNKPTL